MYLLTEHMLPDVPLFTKKLNFLKDIVEGPPLGAPVDPTERSQELSQRGVRGKQASVRGQKKLVQKPKKSKPETSGQPSMKQEESSIDSSESSSESEEEDTLNYFDDQDCKSYCFH